MEVSYHNYPDIAPTIGNYSRAARAGDLFFFAGTTAGGTEAEHGDLPAQVRATLDRIQRVLEAEGQSLGDVVRLVTYVTSIGEWRAHGPELSGIFEEFFRGKYPPNTLIGIAELAEPTMKVEIEATAVF